jgi:TctA family transporter
MARQGRAGPALATAAIGSFFAGTVATFVLVLFAPPLARIALKFGAPEYFSLIVLGLIASIALAHGSIVKALAMIVLGLLFGMVGQDIYTGTPRFTFGLRELYSGINFVSLAVGIFGVAEILRNLEDEKTRTVLMKKVSNLWLSREDFRRIVGPVLRGTGLGAVLGVLPGGGHILAAFASYSLEKRTSRRPHEFGHGAIEGVAGPESANNAAAQTSFIPLLTLGLPAHPVMALMVGAFIIQGITPGPNVIVDEPALFWGLIVSMWIGNLLLVLLNLPLIGIWVRMLTIPYNVLFPAIVAFACIGCYSLNLNAYHVYAIAFFGAVGYVLVKLGCEPAPLLLGFVLGPLLEEHLRRAMIISRGDPTIFFTRPISAGLLIAAAVAIVIAVLPTIRKRREEVFQEED